MRSKDCGVTKYHLGHYTAEPQIHYITQMAPEFIGLGGGWLKCLVTGRRPGLGGGPARRLRGAHRGVHKNGYADVKSYILRFEGVGPVKSERGHTTLSIFEVIEQIDRVVLGE